MTEETITYRGFRITRNFTSIHGTMRRLSKQRGWNVYLPGYGDIGWEPSMADVRSNIDYLRAGNCNHHIARVLERIDAAEGSAQ